FPIAHRGFDGPDRRVKPSVRAKRKAVPPCCASSRPHVRPAECRCRPRIWPGRCPLIPAEPRTLDPSNRSPSMTLSISRRHFNSVALTTLAAAAAGTMPARRAAALDALNFQANWINDPEFLGYMIAIDNGYYAA